MNIGMQHLEESVVITTEYCIVYIGNKPGEHTTINIFPAAGNALKHGQEFEWFAGKQEHVDYIVEQRLG